MGKCLTSALEVAFPVVRSPLRFSFGTGFPTVEIDEERRIFLAIPDHLRYSGPDAGLFFGIWEYAPWFPFSSQARLSNKVQSCLCCDAYSCKTKGENQSSPKLLRDEAQGRRSDTPAQFNFNLFDPFSRVLFEVSRTWYPPVCAVRTHDL